MAWWGSVICSLRWKDLTDSLQTYRFLKVLAQWHRHSNICVLADRSAHTNLSESQCTTQGGHFTAETQWMIHAWIWKDSPTGVFAPTNPTVQ